MRDGRNLNIKKQFSNNFVFKFSLNTLLNTHFKDTGLYI